ncbi:polyprenol monophosphomannose synthase [bacterium]|nr:polyprenol monophosphomannose synthase [candidate division CSSED10-310 bacterium]
MRTAVIVPTYNEVDNIGKLVAEILDLGRDIVVVVVDDNSPDGTAGAVRSMQDDERVILVSRPEKLGLGTAYVAGIRRLWDRPDIDLFLTMDADFSHHPRFIPDLIDGAAHADIVIGSRYVIGGRTVDFAAHRRLISRGANLFAKSLLRLAPRDCTAGFRCYHRRVLATIPLEQLFSKGYSFLVEMLFHCQRKDFKIREVPICYVARAHGLSKISMNEIRYTALTILRLWYRWRFRK